MTETTFDDHAAEPMTYLDALAMTPDDDDPATLLQRIALAAAAARHGATEAEIDRALAGVA